MTPFCTRNIPTMFGVQFLLFPVSTAEKCFSRILMTFPGPDTTGTGMEQAKLKTGLEWLHFAPETYPECLGCSSYCFPSVHLKNITVEFWWLFRVWSPPEQAWSKQNLKIGPGWLRFATRTYPKCLRCSSCRFPSLRQKNISVQFSRLLRVEKAQEQEKLKTGRRWLCFASESYSHCLGCNSYRFLSVRLKNVLIEFDDFSRSRHHRNRPRAGKLKIGPGWLRFAPETYPRCLGSSSYRFPLVRQKNIFRKTFDDFSGTRKHRSWKSWIPGINDLVLHSKHTHSVSGAVLIVSW